MLESNAVGKLGLSGRDRSFEIAAKEHVGSSLPIEARREWTGDEKGTKLMFRDETTGRD